MYDVYLKALLAFHRVAVMLVTLSVLGWSSLAFGDPIHDAATRGDLAKATVLLKARQIATLWHSEEIAQLLRQHGGHK